MKAITVAAPGGPEVLVISDIAPSARAAGEIRIGVRAAGVNGADLLQRRGGYPPPAGQSPIIGLEAAGEVLECDAGSRFKPGDRVMALLAGGGYAEQVVCPEAVVMPIPAGMSMIDAGGVPEVFLTAYLELVMLAGLRAGETALIHAGASGVGSAAIQIARELGARVIATAGSARKLEACRALGAETAIDYTQESFAERVQAETAGRGADVILDLVGAAHWDRNVASLAVGGRILLVGLGGGAKAEVDFRALLAKRARVIASTLRARPLSEKAELVRDFERFGLARLLDGRLKPVIDRVLPLADAAEAHRLLEAKTVIGKVVLSVG